MGKMVVADFGTVIATEVQVKINWGVPKQGHSQWGLGRTDALQDARDCRVVWKVWLSGYEPGEVLVDPPPIPFFIGA